MSTPKSNLNKSVISIIIAFTLSASGFNVNAATPHRTQQKKEAESQRAELKQRLTQLKRDINKTESARDHAIDVLEESEQAISTANRTLHDLQLEQKETEERLSRLQQQLIQLQRKADQQKKQLIDFLRRQYMHGDTDRMKLLLSGDNPNRINRDLQYLSYLSQTQAKLIDALKISLEDLEKNTNEAKEAKQDLDEITEEAKQNKVELEKQKKKHSQVVAQLSDKLKSQRKQVDQMQKDEERLNLYLTKLNQLIEEQNRAEQARVAALEKQRLEKLAAEKQRQAQLLEEKNKKKVDSNVASSKVEKSNSKSIPAVSEDLTRPIVSNAPDGAEFERLKGQHIFPARGELAVKFGAQYGGIAWKGIVIKSPEGSDVRSIADGRVVSVQWLPLFGNLIVVDHGANYLSTYGFNQSVLKHEGDKIKAGDVIAKVGSSGGNDFTGLYFEVRQKGRPIDPMPWLGKK